MGSRARRKEIDRRCCRLPHDLYYDPRYAVESSPWDHWFRDEHDVRRMSYSAGHPASPRRARPRVRQWVGLDTMLALSTAGEVAVLELEMMDAKEEVKEEVVEEQPVAVFDPSLVGQRSS
ncbi:hypothetical protein D1007_61870 [Hordeum vulgare]|nr:hypothetical protein D1007_61870 [Hordeum vulgare]